MTESGVRCRPGLPAAAQSSAAVMPCALVMPGFQCFRQVNEWNDK